MLGIFGQILGPISNLAGTWMQGKVDKAKAETDVKVARAKAEAKVYETEATSSMSVSYTHLTLPTNREE
mgnify:CR=1 FL=1